MIISRTPFRISFFGGGTDYPEWYKNEGGEVLATTIDKYCYLTCRYLPPFFQHRIRVVYSNIEMCQKIDEIKHPAVREVLRFMDVDRGLEVHHDGDLPARSGMGTSSSFTVGLLNAMYALKGQMPTKQQLADQSIIIEHDLMKETVGCQDQISVAYGGFNHVIFPTDGGYSVRPITLPGERVTELNDHLILLYTGISRSSSEIAGTYVSDIDIKEAQLRLIKAMVGEGINILNSNRDIRAFGELLDQAWQLKRDMSPMISNQTVDNIYNRARKLGAIGGKLLGAGGGGFMLLFAAPSHHQRIKDDLKGFIHVPFRFESQGSQIIFHDYERDYSEEDKLRDDQPIVEFREMASNGT